MPERYRALVGKAEVWRPLDTTDRRTANTRCAAMSADLERAWARRSAQCATAFSAPSSTRFPENIDTVDGFRQLVIAQQAGNVRM